MEENKEVKILSNKSQRFSNFDEEVDNDRFNFSIKVIGIGGAGCNVVKHINDNYKIVTDVAKLYAFNTDSGSLKLAKGVPNKFLLNKEELKGYGSGSDPEVGRQAVIHDSEIIKNELRGTDILFIIAGLGKGAGSGGAPELAKIAKELGILTVSIVNMPCAACEGNIIFNNAFNAKQALVANSDSITTISNEKIISNKRDVSFYSAYALANDEIANIIVDIVTIIYKPTNMNIDFADLRTFFKKNKFFMMNRVSFDATNISELTIKNAIFGKIKSSFTDISIEKAKQAICNISMSKKTPTNFVQNINRVLGQYTNNSCLSMSTGIDYNETNQIDVSFLISGNVSENDFKVEISNRTEEIKWHDSSTITINPDSNTDEEYENFLDRIKEATSPTKEFGKS